LLQSIPWVLTLRRQLDLHPRENIMGPTLQPLEGRVLFSAGLSAQYFDNANFTKLKVSRTDPQINFDWGTGSPAASIGADSFSARWTGYLQAQYSEKYTLTATSDDGVRVWIDDNLVINRWTSSAGTVSASIDFTAGSYHAIKVEYYENIGAAKVQLQWSSASTPLQVIPSDQLVTELPKVPPNPDGIFITKGGTYSGNWSSDNPNVAAVIIETTEPVTIVNSTIQSRGDLIVTSLDHTDVTLDNVTGTALNPNIAGRAPGRFLDDFHYDNIVVKNCTLNGTSGILLDTYIGNGTSSDSIKILNNTATNIDGRHSDGAGGFVTFDTRTNKSTRVTEQGYEDVQFLQIAKSHNVPGVEVAGNHVVNEPGLSRVEDVISIYQSGGTSASRINIHDNYIKGAYNVAPWQRDYSDALYDYHFAYSGGGIMLGDGGNSSSTVPAFVNTYNNTVIDTTNYGLAITSGHDLQIYANKVSSTGLLPDGRVVVNQNLGIGIWNANRQSKKLFFNNGGHDNQVYWFMNGIRNDWWVPDATTWLNNVASLVPLG
jgi:hypothetical protein